MRPSNMNRGHVILPSLGVSTELDSFQLAPSLANAMNSSTAATPLSHTHPSSAPPNSASAPHPANGLGATPSQSQQPVIPPPPYPPSPPRRGWKRCSLWMCDSAENLPTFTESPPPPPPKRRRTHRSVRDRTVARTLSPSERRRWKRQRFLRLTRAMDKGMGLVLGSTERDRRAAVSEANRKEAARFLSSDEVRRAVKQVQNIIEHLRRSKGCKYWRHVRITALPSAPALSVLLDDAVEK